MTLTLSAPVRIAALVGLLAAVLGGGAMMMMGRSQAEVATSHVINRHPFGAAKVAKKATAEPAPAAAKPKAVAATPKPVAATPKPAPKPVTPSAVTVALQAGLPAPLARALGRHRVVVISLYNPYSEVDGIAFAEARAGAALAGAGFVPLNVLSRAEVGKLTEMLGLLPDPGVLVYTRPSTLSIRIGGFADKETVAQAAHNAAHGT